MSAPVPDHPPLSARAWAKLDRDTGAALPLAEHGADVAGVLAALLRGTAWADRLDHAAGRRLTERDRAILCALAFLHDLGKASRGFWLRQSAGAPNVGHTNQTAALFFAPGLHDRPAVEFLLGRLEDWGAEMLFKAVMAHHGAPLPVYHQDADDSRPRQDAKHWAAAPGYDPLRELAALLAEAEARFGPAFAPGPKLPDRPAFVALVAGLVTLADWLGSDEALFPVAGPHGPARGPMRDAAVARAVAGRGLARLEASACEFEQVFGFAPRGAQAQAGRLDLGSVALIEAETGSGKTEAALWRWLCLRRENLVDGLYFALPTRSAAVQLHRRVQRMLNAAFGPGAIEAVLAVPGYLRAGDAEGQALPGFEVAWPDKDAHDKRWAAESPRRYLAARVAVGTIDQALMAGLQLRHAHFRAAALSRSLLVVDEVHASDAFMTEVLRALLRNHLAFGGQALLLSATLGAAARSALLDPSRPAPVPPPRAEAEATPYPAVSGTLAAPVAVPRREGGGKRAALRTLPLIDDPAAIAARAVAAARRGASVLVVRNDVRGAVAVARSVAALAPELAFRVNGIPTLHHGRFAPDDRRLLDAAVERAFGRGRTAAGRVLVGTQTLEQSLDIDADLLLTDLAPIDVLLQRIGRLHRHPRTDRPDGFSGARAEILAPASRDLSPYLGAARDRHGLGPLRDGGGVYPDLPAIEASWRVIEAHPVVEIPRDNRRLVEGALHPAVTEALATELGVAWANHKAGMDGRLCADRGTARRFALDAGAAFDALLFPSDEAVATRLGLRDRLVAFDPPLPGPFGQPVGRLTLPDWMAKGIDPEAVPARTGADEEGEGFRLGERAFRYGRFGLETGPDTGR